MAEEDASWASVEFGSAELGDARLTARLVKLAEGIGDQPGASLPQALDAAGLKAAYRFFDNDDVEPDAIVAAHTRATYARIAGMPLVLAVQDTSLLDFSDHVATAGLGMLAHRQSRGIVVHTTTASTPEGVPVGVLAQERIVRSDDPCVGLDPRRKSVDEKESHKWLGGLDAAIAVAEACPGTRVISVADREGDVYDLFAAPRPATVDLLVRAAQDRVVAGPHRRLWATVEAMPVATITTVHVPTRDGKPARDASLTVRFCPVDLRRPVGRITNDQPAVALWAVLASEENPPSDTSPVSWMLLTTCAVATVADALERLAWYARRWGIELFHKVLKSGCRIEAKQLGTADRLARCLALYSVVAWRVMYAAMLARTAPDAPCTAILEPDEWRALACITLKVRIPPDQPPTLRDAVRWIGRLGGFLGRKSDGEPGPTALWRGFQRLHDLSAMYHVMSQ